MSKQWNKKKRRWEDTESQKSLDNMFGVEDETVNISKDEEKAIIRTFTKQKKTIEGKMDYWKNIAENIEDSQRESLVKKFEEELNLVKLAVKALERESVIKPLGWTA
jgi:hypothetical protein